MAFSLFGLFSCNEIPSEHEPFFRLSPDKMEKALPTYPLNQQIDIMVIGIAERHPPFLYFARLVAKNGEKIVPLLLQRLSSVRDEHQLGAILYCLLEIDLEHYEWKNDPKYVPLLQQELAKMTDPALRQEATRALVSEAGSHADSRESSPESWCLPAHTPRRAIPTITSTITIPAQEDLSRVIRLS